MYKSTNGKNVEKALMNAARIAKGTSQPVTKTICGFCGDTIEKDDAIDFIGRGDVYYCCDECAILDMEA